MLLFLFFIWKKKGLGRRSRRLCDIFFSFLLTTLNLDLLERKRLEYTVKVGKREREREQLEEQTNTAVEARG